jgi:hypothetical protein
MVLSTYIIVEWIKTLLENFAKCKLKNIGGSGKLTSQYRANLPLRIKSPGYSTSYSDSTQY